MDLATAYVQIVPTTKGISGELSSVLGKDADTAGKSAGGKFSGAFGTTLKAGIATTAALGTAVIGAGTAFTAAAKDVSAYGDNIDKMSQKVGMSAESYQTWDYVLKISGTEMSNMTTGLKTLTNKFDDAKNGSEKSQEMFKKLGLSMDEISNMSREDLFGAVISGFQGMSDSTERAALANDLFGKSGQELAPLFNTSVEETQRLKDEVMNLGGVMSDDAVKNSAAFQDALTRMQSTFGGVKNSVMADVLPSFTDVVVGLTDLVAGTDGAEQEIQAGVEGLVSSLNSALPKAMEGITTISNAFLQAAPELIKTLGDGIITAIPQLTPTLTEVVMQISRTLIEMLPQLLECGLQVILELADGVSQALPDLIPTIVDVVLQIVETLIDNVDKLIDAAIQIILALADGLINSLPRLIERLPEIIMKIVQALIQNAPKLLEAAIELIVTLANGLVSNIPKLIAVMPEIISSIWDTITSTNWLQLGKDIISGVVNGIKSMASAVWNAIKDICGDALQSAKDFFGIASPSKLMRDVIGKQIPAGMAIGIDDNSDVIEKAMSDMENEAMSGLGGNVQSVVSVQSGNARSLNRSSINGAVSGEINGINAIIEALSRVTVTMDGRRVGTLVATPVNNELGRLNVRRV